MALQHGEVVPHYVVPMILVHLCVDVAERVMIVGHWVSARLAGRIVCIFVHGRLLLLLCNDDE